MYSILVLEAHISPEYVMDKMKLWEIPTLLKHIDLTFKTSWEQTRIVAYIIAQSNSTKTLKASDILKFPWDSKEEIKKSTPEDREELKRKMNETLKYLNNGGRSGS